MPPGARGEEQGVGVAGDDAGDGAHGRRIERGPRPPGAREVDERLDEGGGARVSGVAVSDGALECLPDRVREVDVHLGDPHGQHVRVVALPLDGRACAQSLVGNVSEGIRQLHASSLARAAECLAGERAARTRALRRRRSRATWSTAGGCRRGPFGTGGRFWASGAAGSASCMGWKDPLVGAGGGGIAGGEA